MRISDWSSDVCSSDLVHARNAVLKGLSPKDNREKPPLRYDAAARLKADFPDCIFVLNGGIAEAQRAVGLMDEFDGVMLGRAARSEEHTSELQSLMRISYAVFCLKKNKIPNTDT